MNGFLERCTRMDWFLMPNVSNSYQQHSVWMQELEVSYSQHTWNTTGRTWTRCSGRILATLPNPWSWPNGALWTRMDMCAPACDSSIRSQCAWMLKHLRWLHGIESVQHWESAELDEWWLSCKGSYRVCYRSWRIMNLCMCFLCRKDTPILMIINCIRILRLS